MRRHQENVKDWEDDKEIITILKDFGQEDLTFRPLFMVWGMLFIPSLIPEQNIKEHVKGLPIKKAWTKNSGFIPK